MAWLTSTKIQIGTDTKNSFQVDNLSELAISVIREANGTKKFSKVEIAAVQPLIDKQLLIEPTSRQAQSASVYNLKLEVSDSLNYQNIFSEVLKFYGFDRVFIRKSDPRFSHADLSIITGFSSLILPQRHLIVNFIGDSILLGPLVLPGETSCGNCLFLHRKDKNYLWPAVALSFDNLPKELSSNQVNTAASFAASVISNLVTEQGLTLKDKILEINMKDFYFELRQLTQHPKCGCK